jgi:radical SAM superfamily enzyme with C-terminal helix-hairpin-helix motif
MTANSQPLIGVGSFDGIVERRAVCHQRRTGENSFAMRADDSVVHTKRHSKVVGVDNELFHLGLGHFRGQPEVYHAAAREACGRPNYAAAKIFSGFTDISPNGMGIKTERTHF